jgi:hypothetical protein
MSTILGMLAVAGSWLIFGAVFCGVGSWFFRASTDDRISWADCFWTGLVTATFLLLAVNLILGIGVAVVTVMGVLGLGSLWVNRGAIAPPFAKIRRWWRWLPLGLILVWLTNQALESPLWYDSGLYHFTLIRWANEHALPLGLGNLHGRLAFNQSFFVYVAFLNRLPLAGFGHNLANSLILAAVLLTCVEAHGDRSGTDRRRWLALAFGLVAVFWTVAARRFGIHLSDPSPDQAVFLIELVVARYALSAFDPLGEPRQRERARDLVVLLLGYLITLKLSALFFALVLGGFVFWSGRRTTPASTPKASLGAWLVVLGGLIFWTLRGIVSSGYLVYPVVQTGLPVSWKIPPAITVDEASAVKGWARAPGQAYETVLASWQWLGPWWKANLARWDFVAPLALVGLALVIMLVTLIARRRWPAPPPKPFAPLAVATASGASLAFWFASAPDARFMGAAAYLLPLALWEISFATWKTRAAQRAAAISLVALGLLLAAVCLATQPGWITAPRGCLTQPIPVAKMAVRQTDSGLRVWVPEQGDLSWDAPLPCTPYFHPELQFRAGPLFDEFRLKAPK